MTALSKLAYHRMEEIRLLALICKRCGHRLSAHSQAANQCRGAFDDKAACECAGWVEPAEELAFK